MENNNKDNSTNGTEKDLNKESISSLFPSHEEILSSIEPATQDDHETEKSLPSVKFEELSRNQDNESTDTATDYDKAYTPSEYTEQEKEALGKGWKPKDQYKGNPNDWVKASEFLVRGRMINQMDQYKSEISKLSKSQGELMKMVKKQGELLTNKVGKDILEKKRGAIEDGDVEKAEQYETEYHEVEEVKDSFKDLELKKEVTSDAPPEFEDFISRNSDWYNYDTNDNMLMVGYAKELDQKLMAQYPQWSLAMRLEKIESGVKNFFKTKFENPERSKPGLVEASHKRVVTDPSKVHYQDLPPDVRQVVDRFMKIIMPFDKNKKAAMTKDEYAQQLLMTGAIKWEN